MAPWAVAERPLRSASRCEFQLRECRPPHSQGSYACCCRRQGHTRKHPLAAWCALPGVGARGSMATGCEYALMSSSPALPSLGAFLQWRNRPVAGTTYRHGLHRQLLGLSYFYIFVFCGPWPARRRPRRRRRKQESTAGKAPPPAARTSKAQPPRRSPQQQA